MLLLMLGFPASAPAAEQIITEVLAIGPVLRGGRAVAALDPIELSRISGTFRAPAEGDSVDLAGGRSVSWQKVRANQSGWIESEALVGGYAFATVSRQSESVMLLEAAGHTTVIVNGEPRVGDPYESGYVRLPVLLRKGVNELLFVVGRGRFRAKLVDPPRRDGLFVEKSDVTAPDFVAGRPERLPFAAVSVNPTTQPVGGVPPLSLRKLPAWFDYDGKEPAPRDSATGVEFRVRQPSQPRKVTFISDIDGSVQYYAINPASELDTTAPRGMVLSLHGAGVEAIGQAEAYSSKPWADIVCPTNRRPFGFDWEAWGRLDAIEVLDHAMKRLRSDPSLVYLTGHSMGGHGTWQLGALFPDRFAAIGPSAGWISFLTYASTQPATAPASPVIDMLRRCNVASDTTALVTNYAGLGVYILHGADDDNVPAEQARQMIRLLEPFHRDFRHHEQPAAGHWWDESDEPGADCVDWPAMFDFFARHRVPGPHELRELSFITPDPGVTSRFHWLTIEAQQRALQLSSATLRIDPQKRRISGTTKNVARMALDLMQLKPDAPISFDLDGQVWECDWPARGRVWLNRVGNAWAVIDRPARSLKGPHRSGPFKDAFRNRMTFVYGTRGTPDENAWALAKARFDAENWWYRGNGSVPVVADLDFDPTKDPDGNVILYGNAQTNSRWNELLSGAPIHVSGGVIRVGENELQGENLACLFIRPRPGSDVACVAAVSGSGLAGFRLTDRLPLFISGVGLPDLVVLHAVPTERGHAQIRAAGFFGNDWGIESGEFVFQEK